MGVAGNVVLTGTNRCAPAEAETWRAAATPDHFRLTRAQRGCPAFDIRETADPCVFEVSERFRGEPTRQASTRTSAWRQITGHMSRNFEFAHE